MMEKPISILLQAGAALMFVHAGTGGNAVLLVGPAIVSGIAGLMLWTRSMGGGVVGGRHSPATLEGGTARVEELRAGLQEDVSDLREDRDFYRELYLKEGQKQPLLRGELPPERG